MYTASVPSIEKYNSVGRFRIFVLSEQNFCQSLGVFLLTMSVSSSNDVFSRALPLAERSSIVLMSVSVIFSWVFWDPPKMENFSDWVIRLCPSSLSKPTPRRCLKFFKSIPVCFGCWYLLFILNNLLMEADYTNRAPKTSSVLGESLRIGMFPPLSIRIDPLLVPISPNFSFSSVRSTSLGEGQSSSTQSSLLTAWGG